MSLMSDVVALVNEVTLGLEMQAQDSKKVTLLSYTGDGGEGAPAYASSKKVSAVVQAKARLVRGSDGQQVASSTTLTFLDPTVVVKPKDLITLPGETAKREVIDVSSPIDASGVLIREAYLG